MSIENPKGKESLQAPELSTPDKLRQRPRLPTLVITKFNEGQPKDLGLSNDSALANSSAKLLPRFRNEMDDLESPAFYIPQPQEKASSSTDLAEKKDTEVNAINYESPPKAQKPSRAAFFRSKSIADKPVTFSAKSCIEKMYESRAFNVLFGLVIFLSLFLRDLWIIVFGWRQTDIYCDGLLFGILLFFVLESILNCIAFKKYRFSFVFFLDSLSTLTIFVDTTIIFQGLDSEGQDFKNSYMVRILKLFTILKIWRATRLYFRKNQIAVYKPITIETVDALMNNYIKKNQRSQVQPDFSNYTSENSEEDEVIVRKDTLQDHIEVKRRMGSRSTIKIAPEDVLQSPLAGFKNFGRDRNGDKGMSSTTKKGSMVLPAKLQSDDLHLHAEGFQKEVAIAKFKVPSIGNLAEVEQGSRQMAAEKVKQFVKQSRRYLTKVFSDQDTLSSSVAEYKMQQSGNISKTLSYTNVRNLACFLLLSNLGLSIFLSSIFSSDPDICVVDKKLVKLFLEEGAQPSELKEYFERKYIDEASVSLIRYQVKGIYQYMDQDLFGHRRINEEIICDDTIDIMGPDNTKNTLQIIISLDNRRYTVLNSMMNLLRNVVLIFILIINIYGVNKDTRTLILNPLDKLFKNVIFSN